MTTAASHQPATPEAAAAAAAAPLTILLVGFAPSKVVDELLPLFLSFAPPGSSITVSVPQQGCDEWLPQGLEKVGSMHREEEGGPGGALIQQALYYRWAAARV